MTDHVIGPFSLGIDNVSPETTLQRGSVRDAINCDFDLAGGFSRRRGVTRSLTGAGRHSIWQSRARGATYCVSSGALCRLRCDGSTITATSLFTLTNNDRGSFDDLNDTVVFSNGKDICLIKPDDSVRLLGVEQPQEINVSAETFGGLYPGRYGAAYSYIANGEESGLSPASFIDVAENGGIRYAITQPQEQAVTNVRLYRTPANGDLLYVATTIPVGISDYLLGAVDIGRLADNQFQDRMLPGHIVRPWRGRVLVARPYSICFSQSLRYGRFDPRHDVIPVARTPTLMEPVNGGVYVGSGDGVFFLAGTKPDDMTVVATDGKPPIRGSGRRVDAAELGSEYGAPGKIVALWLARNGYIVGMPDGTLRELQGNRVRVPESQWDADACTVLHQRRLLTVID